MTARGLRCAWARQATTARDELTRQVEASETARVEAETARADTQHALANLEQVADSLAGIRARTGMSGPTVVT